MFSQMRLRLRLLCLLWFVLAASCSSQDCNKFRQTRIGDLKWQDLVRRATGCLSADEFNSVKTSRSIYQRASSLEEFELQTVQEAIDDNSTKSNRRAQDILNLMQNLNSKSAATSVAPASRTGSWIPQTVQFIYVTERDDKARYEQPPNATSFILSIQNKAHSQRILLLITARHVVEPSWAHCLSPDPRSIVVRFNRRSGGVAYARLPLRSGDKSFYLIDSTHNDSDLAVIFLTHKTVPELDSYQIVEVPFYALPTDSELARIGPNTSVFTAGLLPNLPGAAQNLPILKSGVISSIPDEAMDVPCEYSSRPKPTRLWIFSPELSAGASGSPMFAMVNRGPDAKTVPILIGVQSTTWIGEGISGFTPADRIVMAVTEVTKGFDLDLSRGPQQ